MSPQASRIPVSILKNIRSCRRRCCSNKLHNWAPKSGLVSKAAEQTKIKFVDSVSAHKYVAAQYMKDWEDKVERTGNLNYPEVAAKKNFSGTLTMDVGIKADGSIYSIRINQSSGNPALDEAAKRIVRMSAPFAPLPVELLKELDVLVITRVWKFSDESGMTSP